MYRKKKKYKVVVDGYWKTNLGDDLFLKILCDRYKTQLFNIFISESDLNVFKSISNLKAYAYISNNGFSLKLLGNRLKILCFKAYSIIGRFIYVKIGGSIFMYHPGETKKKKGFLAIIEKYEDKSKYIIGSNFGPYFEDYQIKETRAKLSRVIDVCFRDHYSQNVFQALNNVRYAPDVILSMNIDQYKNVDQNYILISIVDLSSKGDPGLEGAQQNQKDYEVRMAKLINYYASIGEQVLLMSFCDFQGDKKAAERIKDYVEKEYSDKVSIYSHNNIEASLNIISKAKKIIATRFHAMILGWVFKKPVLAISYSEKTNRVVESCNSNQTILRYNEFLNSDISKIESSFTVIDEDVYSQITVQAQEQFNELDKVLK